MPPKLRPVVRRSRNERRVTFGLKVVALVVLSALAVGAVLDFLGRIPSVTVILIGAIFFTYVIYPIVRFIHRRGAPLGMAIALTYLGIIAIVAVGVTFVLPTLISDTTAVVAASPHLVSVARGNLEHPTNPFIARLPPIVRAELAKIPDQLTAFAQHYASLAASRFFAFVASILGLIATLVVIPVISLYLIFEAPDGLAIFLRAVPEEGRPKALAVVHDIDSVLGGFIRGQLTVGATIGACITIALFALHVKYALLIGVVAGLFDVIPYVGAIVGFVPSVTLALLNDGWQHAAIVAAVFVLIFQLEGHFVAPRIVSESVGLSPLMVIVAILIGGELGGIGGMFLAVPVAGVLRVAVLHVLPRVSTDPNPVETPTIAETAVAAGLASDLPAAKKAERVVT